MIPLAKELRKRRHQRNYTQSDVAALLGISLRQYMYYEKDHWPPHKQLLKLNTLFQYDFSRHIYDNRITKRGNTNNG